MLALSPSLVHTGAPFSSQTAKGAEQVLPTSFDYFYNRSYNISVDVAMLGDRTAGKSCLVRSFDKEPFVPGYRPTIVPEVHTFFNSAHGLEYRFRLWDVSILSGHESLLPVYLKKCFAFIIVYDTTNRASFENLNSWLTLINAIDAKQHPIVLVGNKIDRVSERQVSREEATAWAQQHGANFFETSAMHTCEVEKIILGAFRVALRRQHQPHST